MEPVLTQEELEAIYEAMQGDAAPSMAVDDFALTAGHEFVSRAEAKWTEVAEAMAPRIGSILTGALGKRIKIEVVAAESINSDDGYGGQLEGESVPSSSLDGEASVITVIKLGQTRLLVGIGYDLARRFIERRTGASSDAETETTAAADLTVLERRLLNDLVYDLALVAAQAAPNKCSVSIDSASPDEVWQGRSKKEMWMSVSFTVVQNSGSGIWLRGLASTFLPRLDMGRQTITRRLESAKIVLAAELGKFRMNVNDLWKLKFGSIVPLEAAVGDPLKIIVGGVPKLEGEPLVSRGNIAIRITGRSRGVDR